MCGGVVPFGSIVCPRITKLYSGRSGWWTLYGVPGAPGLRPELFTELFSRLRLLPPSFQRKSVLALERLPVRLPVAPG